ncbi:MAG: sigma-54-dependent Fis family transcriptional regulator [Candidatus Tectomicrobia bacterium]|uniref:Sigma-54-dependent Fis family transcriptional regulator n=1 Tax=Tectimicrobiota bacterium TaxID=2528274 RepID=A0A932ZT22_UNCTE|nr:sigma-54-dependent Fis family transcriptional regulator [Candidatus Tectomicrobia bacterium]
MKDGASILVVDDEERVRTLLARLLGEEGYHVASAASAEEALHELEGGSHDVVLTDLMMPGMSGLELLEEIRRGHPETSVILVTAHGTVDSAVEAMRKGAFHYVCKPFKLDEVRIIVQRAIEESQTKHELAGLRREVHQRFEFSNIIGKSKPIQEVFDLIRRVARSTSTVLIEGKSGTGKELVAKAIHYNSPRTSRPCDAINCSAITETLLESELFGHMKGSFTGAVASKKGLFEEAQGGTIFLDEIGEISAALQVKLLRVLQDHEIRRVGGNQPLKVDVRVIAATNRDLAEAVRQKEFRDDFYYRLNVVTIHLPSLKDRPEDIPILAQHFLAKYAKEAGSSVTQICKEAMRALLQYAWPGNIRELENVIERAITLGAEGEIRVEDLPDPLRREEEGGRLDAIPVEMSMQDVEKAHIERVLRHTGGQVSQAARLLGIDRRTIYRKMQAYNIRKD